MGCTKETNFEDLQHGSLMQICNKNQAGEHPQKKSGNTQHTLQPGELLKGREKHGDSLRRFTMSTKNHWGHGYTTTSEENPS